MPRTRCKKEDKRTNAEKLARLSTKVDRFIFFGYYDGIRTNGALGFDMDAGRPGSARHRTGLMAKVLTANQFRNKGRKMAELAEAFLDSREEPDHQLRPLFSVEEIEELERAQLDTRTPDDKLMEVVDETELIAFFLYYDGMYTDGEIGFDPKAGPPGSINHKRSFREAFADWNESQFRYRGKQLGTLAKSFVENGIVPPDDRRPEIPQSGTPWGLIEAALEGGY